jgi:hypothetical protein
MAVRSDMEVAMPTSQKTFEQVKNILGKLDARIDSLRQRRTEPYSATSAPSTPIPQDGPATANAAAGTGLNQARSSSTVPTPGGSAAPATPAAIGPDTLIGVERPRGHTLPNGNNTNPLNQYVADGGSAVPKAAPAGSAQTPPTTQTRQGPLPPGTPGRSPFGRATPIRPLSA